MADEQQTTPKQIKKATVDRLIRAKDEVQRIIDSPIETNEDYVASAEDLKTIMGFKKSTEEMRRKIVDPLNASVKAVNDYFRPASQFLDTAATTRKRQIIGYQNKQEEIARKAAEEEARRLEVLAERRAQTAEKKGDDDRAEQERIDAQQQAAVVRSTAMSRATPAPKVSGISSREIPEFEVVSLMDLVKAVADGRAPLTYLAANETAIRKVVNALKLETSIPGVVVTMRKSVSARSA